MKYVLVAGGYVLCSSGLTTSYKPVEMRKIWPFPFGRKAMVFHSTEEAALIQHNLEGYNYYDLAEWRGPWWKGRRKKVKIPKRSRVIRNT
jgi:hypothetical protein